MDEKIYPKGFCQWLRDIQTDEQRAADRAFFGTTRPFKKIEELRPNIKKTTFIDRVKAAWRGFKDV